MAKVLYRKYRSKSLSEVVGQEHITKTLEQAIKTNRLSHAYLFTGPKGVGKTSVARILAHEVNKLPYTSDRAQIDIIEIDAASNRRIDEIRYLRDRVYIAPTSAKFKVYIIDEVHMLTKEAFNALLKTLEEPPEHVIFILATTDASKLPDTIISRTQRFNFKPAEISSIISLLKKISKSEKISINDEALKLIAEHGNGSYRDSIGLLDQLANYQHEITADYVTKSLGLPSEDIVQKIIDLIETDQSSYQPLIDRLSELISNGIAPSSIASSLMNIIRFRLVNNTLTMPKKQAVNLLRELINVESSADPATFLEITLIDNINLVNGPVPEKKTEVIEPKQVAPVVSKPLKKTIPMSEDAWQAILDNLKSKHNTLYSIVQMAKPVFGEDNNLVLLFDFPFHQKQLKDEKNKQMLVDAVDMVTSEKYNIEFLLNEKRQNEKETEADLDNINKIFGQTELLD